MSADRTAEIWATRLQREVGALASLAESNAVTEEVAEDDTSHVTPKHDNLNIASLPPFIKVDSHELDISKGICKVMFSIQVHKPPLPESATERDEGENEVQEATTKNSSNEKPTASLVFVTLDASMGNDTVYYPFQKPLAILSGGEEIFPPKSTIRNEDLIDLDCDWTPSLHLSDAILNVALKIRESVRRGDPFLTALSTMDPSSSTQQQQPSFPTLFTPTSVDEISSSVSSFLGSLRRRKNEKDVAPPSPSLPPPPKDQRLTRQQQQVQIGDTISLSEPPYSNCAGMFSCKAIRRPEFVERAIAEATREKDKDSDMVARRNAAALSAQEETEENEIATGPGNYMRLHAGGIRKVAASGILGASSFLRSIEKSIVQSTKAVLEEHYLLITENHILEIRSSKLNIDTGTVIFVSPVSSLIKLKFRRDESITLFFKQSAVEDPLVYLCQESYEAVQTIQNVLQKHGVKGKHTTTAVQKQLQAALKVANDIREKEGNLENNPTLENVNEIMDLYRQAAEKFENSNDPRHEQVISDMHTFLAKPLVKSILENEVEDSHVSTPAEHLVTSDDEDEGETERDGKKPDARQKESAESRDSSLKEVDDMMKEVEKLSVSNLDDDLSDFMLSNASTDGSNVDDHDPVAELDAMLIAADKELNDLLEST
jgi:hypothetical protein